jgi:hypothetical protein
MDENDELFDEPEMPRPEEEDELPALMVWVNAGFGRRSYPWPHSQGCVSSSP